jgi:hypothetical protein
MKDEIIPLNCIRQLQFQTYKTALIPIFVIALGFILQFSKVNIPYIQYIMGLAFVSYFLILFIYRIGKPIIPENEFFLVSPVHGKILSVTQVNHMVKIQVQKAFFDPIELRCPTVIKDKVDDSDVIISYGEHEILMSFGDKTPRFFHDPGKVKGSLLGLVPGTFVVTIEFNESILGQPLKIKKNDLVKAGESILVELKEKS